MTQGIKVLRKIQLGQEHVAAGTLHAATVIMIGSGTLKDNRELAFQRGEVGAYAGSGNSRTAKLGGQLDFEQDMTFEQSPIMFSAGIKSVLTAASDAGAGASGKIYAFPFANTAPNTIATWSIEGGDNAGAEVLNYGYVSKFNISGKGGEPLVLKSTWLGRQVVPQAYTGGLTIPTAEVILFSRGTLAIDDSGDVIGATPVSNTFLGMSLDVETGWRPRDTADGLTTPTFSSIRQAEPKISLDITFEHEATSIAEKVKWRAEAWRKLRLSFLGSALATAGTGYTYKTLNIDLMGKWSSFDKLDEDDGNDIVHGIFDVKYSDAAGDLLSAAITVVNEVAALPA